MKERNKKGMNEGNKKGDKRKEIKKGMNEGNKKGE